MIHLVQRSRHCVDGRASLFAASGDGGNLRVDQSDLKSIHPNTILQLDRDTTSSNLDTVIPRVDSYSSSAGCIINAKSR